MANPVWIRKYLTDRGYADKDVGYDSGRKQVTLQGKDFYSGAPDASGHVVGQEMDFDKALNTFNTNQNQAQLKTVSDAMVDKATTAPTPFTAAPGATPYKAPAAYGGFNAESNPEYQAALRRATANAQTGTNNALVALGSKGIGNSQSAVSAANQINAREFGNVTDNLLPKMMEQDYNRYRDSVNDAQYADTTNYNRTQDAFKNQNGIEKDNYGLTQDQMANLNSVANYLSGQGQQTFNNNRLVNDDARQLQNDHLALADKLSKEYGIQVSPKDDPALVYKQVQGMTPLELQQFKQNMAIDESKVTGTYKGKPTYDAQQAANKAVAAASKLDAPGSPQDKLSYEGEIANEISQLLQMPNVTEEDINGFLEANRGDVTKHLTTAGFDRLAKSAKAALASGSKVLKDTNKEASALRKEAITLAKNDPDWYDETLREGLIKEYTDLLSVK